MTKRISLCRALIKAHLQALKDNPEVSITFWDVFLSYVIRRDRDLYNALVVHEFFVDDGSLKSHCLESCAWDWIQDCGVINPAGLSLSHRCRTLS